MAMYRTAERVEFMFDNYATMSSCVQLLSEKYPNSQEVCYLKQGQQSHGS
jgi:hypothetical protein